MRRKNILTGSLKSLFCGLMLATGALGLTGCKETIDSSNFAIADDPTVYDYLEGDTRFSDILAIFKRVNVVNVPEGSSYTASSIANTLQTRGNYTCFIPTNEAVEAYVEGLTGSTDVSSLTYEQAENIAKNCLIDNGDNSAYESPDFPPSGSFAISNMNDRILTCEEVSTDESGAAVEPYYLINGEARVTEADIEVSNGMIHVIDRVIAPSSNTVPDMIREADNMRIFARLLAVTGWDVRTTDYRDQDYEEQEKNETERFAGETRDVAVPTHRYLGYTIFAEPDDVYTSQWACPEPQYNEETGEIENWDAIEAVIRERAAVAYPDADASQPLTSEDNPVNRFVAYHILEGRIAYDRFVHHLNEYNYRYIDIMNPATRNYTVDVWDYYTTAGSHSCLLKVLQTATGDYPIYINRVCEYNKDTYAEESVRNEGIRILATNGANDNNALNGFYYPISGILTYDSNVRQLMGNERIRVDMTTMLPEMSSNNLRGGNYAAFTNNYFSNITNVSDGTQMFYLNVPYSPNGAASVWRDYQGDEFLFCGIFDFVLKLPPVPVDGTYEIRMGLSNNTLRGMAQIYVGSDVNNLLPTGLPIDMRQSVSNNPNIPWVEDTDDEVVDQENDRNLRNKGYMKGPQYFMTTNGLGSQGGTPIRDVGGQQCALRYIITRTELRADETYYLRFKSALDQRDAQFFMDYFELVNSSVYNGVEAEDIW